MTPSKVLIVVPVDREPRLTVLLTRDVKATNGQEFLRGQSAGFTPESSVSLVVAGAGKAYCHDQAAGKDWAQALVKFGKFDERDMEKLLAVMTGPFAAKVRDMERQISEAQEAGRKRDALEAAEAQKLAEEKAAADKLKAEQDAAQAEVKAKEAAELKALQDAEEKRIAEETAALAADGLAKGTADVSNPDVSADAMANKEPAPTPPAPEPSTRRGNRTPRS